MAVLKFPAALTFYSNSRGACGMFSCGHTNNEIVFRTNYLFVLLGFLLLFIIFRNAIK